MSLVEEIQARALDRNVSVSDLLRSVKLSAAKLKLNGTLGWVEHELNGYLNVEDAEIPPYRWTSGTLMENNRFHGPRIATGDYETIEMLSTVKFNEPTSGLEAYLSQKTDFITFSIGSNYAQQMADQGVNIAYYVSISKSTVVTILDTVRNYILDWAIKLEEEGILGEGVSFSMDEKRKAADAGASVNITNYGHIHQGDITGHQNRTTVSSTDNSKNSLSIDVFEQVQSVINNNVANVIDRKVLLSLLKEMGEQKNSNGYRELYSKFLVAAANHMTVLAPFLPALGAHLSG